MLFSCKNPMQYNADTPEKKAVRTPREPNAIWHCREPWFGDSRDGQFINGEGYHYFSMKGEGTIERALEWYESDDGEEHVADIPELIGVNWYKFFGFEDDEILETVPAHEFMHIENLLQPPTK
jgi:hypothetical protein